MTHLSRYGKGALNKSGASLAALCLVSVLAALSTTASADGVADGDKG